MSSRAPARIGSGYTLRAIRPAGRYSKQRHLGHDAHGLRRPCAACRQEKEDRLKSVHARGTAAVRPPASTPYTRLLFTVHGFAREAAAVAAGDRDVLRRARYAALAGAFQLRRAAFVEGPRPMRRDSWTHGELAGKSRSRNKD
jgi:hypothetical protein